MKKSLLCTAAACALASASTFAGQDSTIHGSVDTSSPEMLNEQYVERWDGSLESGMPMNGSEDPRAAEMALEEGNVLYIYPVEVTEYYLIVPESADDWS